MAEEKHKDFIERTLEFFSQRMVDKKKEKKFWRALGIAISLAIIFPITKNSKDDFAIGLIFIGNKIFTFHFSFLFLELAIITVAAWTYFFLLKAKTWRIVFGFILFVMLFPPHVNEYDRWLGFAPIFIGEQYNIYLPFLMLEIAIIFIAAWACHRIKSPETKIYTVQIITIVILSIFIYFVVMAIIFKWL